ncbi:MAG: hypothetical protein M1594_00330 [Candidatus Marsarchaeota archaeon]|nr:hypothetical protein [Candidatus Marsarchaeota archaeon]
MDRDVNASMNIRARGLKLKPDGGVSEAMVVERSETKSVVEPIHSVDTLQPLSTTT